MKPQPQEDKLVAHARRGDARSFGELYDRYVSPIYRFILLRVGDRASAEDLTQEVFTKAWRNIRTYKKRKHVPFTSWLYRIASNAVIDHYRTERNHADVESEAVIESVVSDFSPEFVDTNLELEAVYQALRKLSDVEQQVIVMRFVEELSVKETALALGKKEGAVRVMQHRGLKKLQEHVRGH